MSKRWRSQKEGFQEALHYMRDRKAGLITSFKTPYKALNYATVDGLEWGSTTVIAGRPGSGKTCVKDQIIRDGVKLNCTPEEYDTARFPFRILEFQLEMVSRVSALREFSSVIEKSYKYLCSTDGVMTDDDMKHCLEYAKLRVQYPIDVIDEPCVVNEFESIIEEYMEEHSYIEIQVDEKTGEETPEKKYRNTLISLDHSILLEKDKSEGEKDKYDMLYHLGPSVTKLKKRYPICFIILSQLNRNVDSIDRAKEASYGNYVLDSDLFGGDALLQHADTLIGLNRPGERFIKQYGPEKYIIADDSIIVMHFLKCRNGEKGLCFFQEEFHKMRLKPIPNPPKG